MGIKCQSVFLLQKEFENNLASKNDEKDKAQLEQKCYELKSENENLNQILINLRDFSSKTEDKNIQLHKDISSLNKTNRIEFEELLNIKTNLEKEISILNVTINQLNESLHNKDLEINRHKDTLIKIDRDSLDFCKTFVKQAEDHEFRLKSVDNQYGVEIIDLKNNIDAFKTLYEEEKALNQNHIQDIYRLKKCNVQLELEINLNKQNTEVNLYKITELNNQILTLTVKSNDLKDEIDSISKVKASRDSDIQELSMRLCDLHGENENLLKELYFSKTKINELETKISLLVDQPSNMEISSKNLSESLMEKFDNFDNKLQQKLYDLLVAENNSLLKMIEASKEENIKIMQQIKNENDVVNKKLAHKHGKEILQLNKKIESLKKTNEHLTEQLEILNQQFIELNKENSITITESPIKQNMSVYHTNQDRENNTKVEKDEQDLNKDTQNCAQQ